LLGGLRRPFAGTFDDATAALEELLSDAVRLQAQTADVPLGAFLSGGVDSSTVVALMQRFSRRQVQTYSIGFAEDGFNEAGYAKAVAGYLGTCHSELYVSSTDALQVVPKLPFMYDEPLADSSQIPTFLVAQLARTEVTVALSGDGGDELFAGYPRYAFGSSIAGVRGRQLLGATLQAALRSHLDLLTRVLPTPVRGRLARRRLETLSMLLTARSFRQIAESVVELNRESASLVQMPVRRDSAFSSRRPLELERAYGQMAMLLDRETYLPDDVLHKVDRATMAVSLESRAPLLDHRIAEFAATLPMSFLMKHGENKRVLRAVLYRMVPRDLVDRPKAGFSIPLGRWLRAELREWAWELLDSRKLADILDMDGCRQLFKRHLTGERDLSLACWGVFSALAWAEAWL
jgi:asparagine synthase (glutamine-hydrolysing)